MAHADAGHYTAKHPEGMEVNPQIATQIKTNLVDGRISCAAAHKIAEELQVSPADVGVTIDLLEVRITQCLLGLFGYSPNKRIVVPAEHVSPELQQALEEAMDEKGLSCVAAWGLAKQRNISKLDISSACEALKIKITSCQLGTFGK